MSEHACKPPLLARLNDEDVLVKLQPGGELWRCDCGQLWQNSPTQGDWVAVEPDVEAAFEMLEIDMPGLPSILSVEPEPADKKQPCICFCGARHRERMGVCEGNLRNGGYRIHFNSVYDSEGVLVCRPCAEALPEGVVP